ncbi:MAG: glycosyltransferase [Kiritimatiellae bacterium]|nr:glycosyltransferase [Kiritimatiellia bacterium]
MRLTIVVPARNEEHRIGRMLDAYLPYFTKRYGDSVEFLVVVNGSTDRTEQVVGEYAARYPQLRFLIEPAAVGKGGALMRGFAAARGELVGFVDADGSTPPEAFQELVDKLADAGAIIASRWCAGARVSPRQPLLRQVASRIFNLLTRALFGLPLTDTQCGAKLMKREALMQVLPRLGITRWAFDVDLLFQLKQAGFKVTEIPTTWHDVAGSHVVVGSVATEMFAALVRLRLLHSPFRWIVRLYDKTLGPFIHPAGLEQDRLYRHSFLLLVGAQVTNAFNTVTQIAMVRMLVPSEYGTFAAMTGAFLLLTVPLSALGRTVTHFFALFIGRRDGGKARAVVRLMTGDLVSLAALMLVFEWMMADRHSAFFNVPSVMPFRVTIVTFALWLPSLVVGGILTGAQLFGWSAAVGLAASCTRCCLSILMAAFGLGAVGALSAQAVAILVGILLSLVPLRRVLPSDPPAPVKRRDLYGYFTGYFVALCGYSVLTSADVVLVKHYFADPTVAGEFAVAAMVAKIAFFLPQPVVMAMFPKVVTAGELSYASWRTLLKALTLVAGVTLAAAILCTVFPEVVLWIMKGEVPPGVVHIIRRMVWAVSPLTLVFLVMNFHLAQRRFRVNIPLVICALGYLLAVARWHATVMEIVTVLGIAGWAAMFFALAGLPWWTFRFSRAENEGRNCPERAT